MTKLKFPVRIVSLTVAAVLCMPALALACSNLTLTFNARTGIWRVGPADCGKNVDFDINGRPTVFVKSTVKVSVRIEQINPLAYGVHYGDVSIEPIEGLADLQSLFTAAGGLAQLLMDTNAMDVKTMSAVEKQIFTKMNSAYEELKRAQAALLAGLRKIDADRDAVVRAAQSLEEKTAQSLKDEVSDETVVFPTMTIADVDTLFTNLRKALEEVADHAPADDVAVIDKALATHGKAIKSLMSVRLALAPFCKSPCTGMITVKNELHLTDVVRRSEWDKIATYPIKIARTGLLADDIVTSMPKEISTSIKVASPQAALLGASVGVITASPSSPTWTAVADPANKDQKLVTQTGAQRFRVVPALIGTYAFSQKNARRVSRPMLEFGSSLDPGQPAWFVGVGLSVGGGLRLGAGIVTTRVNALDGQDTNTVVSDNDAIKTKSRWDGGYYFSFGLSLSSLNLFKKD